MCLMYGFTGFSGNFFTTMLPLFLTKQRHLSADQIAWLSALPLAGGSIACILGGTASDWAIRRFGNRKWGRRYVGLVGLSLAGPALLAVNWAESVWLLALLLTASFSFNDLTMGPAWAACADIGERFAGTLSGAMNMISALAGGCGAHGGLPFRTRAARPGLRDIRGGLLARGNLLARRRRYPAIDRRAGRARPGIRERRLMPQFKVALVANDLSPTPAWVGERLEEQGIDLVDRACAGDL